MIIRRRTTPRQKTSDNIENIQNEKTLQETVEAGAGTIPVQKELKEPSGNISASSEVAKQAVNNAPVPSAPKVLTPEAEMAQKLEEIEKIDITSLEFKERFERRRGERRRGYRRIDERTLVSRAQEEAQSIRELAAKEGYKNGIEEAHTELETLKASLTEFLGSKKEAYDALSDDMLELSLEIAKKIIKKEVELSDDILKGVLSEVFDEISSNEEKITIKVAPDEVDFARASMPDVLKNSAIDANFSTQLAIIQNAFGIYKGGN